MTGPRPLASARPAASGRCAVVGPAVLIPSAAALGAYLPALAGGFIWNDSDYVTAPALRSLSGLRRIWFEVGAVQQYYPVLHTAFWIEHRLWGDAPLGYHLVNILLHATAAGLFAAVLRRLSQVERVDPDAPAGSAVRSSASGSTRSTWDWPFAGLLFAVLPVGVVSVAWISVQKNTLSTVFYLLAALAYMRWRERARPSLYFLATFLFILALLSKSVTATLPAALLVVFWWRRGRLSWKRDVVPLLPWFVLGAGAGLFTGWVERNYVGAQGADFALGAAQRVLVAGRAIAFYLGKLLWPVNLSFIYPRWSPDAGAGWQYLYPLAVLGLLLALWWYRRRSRGPLAAFLFFTGSLFPVRGFFNVYAFVFSYVAVHLQYLASLGVIAAVAAGWGRWHARAGGAAVVVAAGVVVLLGAMTWRQCRMYGEADRFFQAILDRNPDAWMAHVNLGLDLRTQGRIPEAIGHFESALRLKPEDVTAMTNLGLALNEAGRSEEAIAHCADAVRRQPNFAEGRNNLGICLAHGGRLEDAPRRGASRPRSSSSPTMPRHTTISATPWRQPVIWRRRSTNSPRPFGCSPTSRKRETTSA